jgi:hypothetical protein
MDKEGSERIIESNFSIKHKARLFHLSERLEIKSKSKMFTFHYTNSALANAARLLHDLSFMSTSGQLPLFSFDRHPKQLKLRASKLSEDQRIPNINRPNNIFAEPKRNP